MNKNEKPLSVAKKLFGFMSSAEKAMTGKPSIHRVGGFSLPASGETRQWLMAAISVILFGVAFAAVQWGLPYSPFFWLLIIIAGGGGLLFVVKAMPEGSDDTTQNEWFNPNNGY